METALNFILGIIASILATVIYDGYKARKGIVTLEGALDNRGAPLPEPIFLPTPQTVRERNRARLKLFFQFVGSFYALYAAIHLPLMMKSLPGHEPLFFDQARFIGALLPHYPVGPSLFELGSALVAAILYFPILYISLIGAVPVVSILGKFIEVRRSTVFVTTVVVFALSCLAVSVGVVYLYYDVTAGQAFVSVLMMIFFGAAISGSSGRR
ncbi:hypothetical protein [Azospirillum himalayense]|uniref:Uncharacterized protein n=1 Tax=Azospirillum himalayense TaxID=654847 RepID=A0ABW0G120_9PROT